MLLRRVTLLLFAVVLVSACGAATSAAPETLPTVPVGDLPAPVTTPDSADDELESPESTVPRSTSTLPTDQQIGAIANGNRVILIGDSVMASTSRRYTNDMCDALVPLGWQVEVDAETSRFIQFGNSVLDKRLSAGWDVGVILLGNNYNGDQDAYRVQLEKMVTRLSPGPVVLLTVSEFIESRIEVNDVIFELADKYANVRIVDWAKVTFERPDFTGADGLHLTDLGREGLAMNVAFSLGRAPKSPGKCLTTNYTDDSGGPVTGTTVKAGSVTSTTKKPSSGSTTTSTAKDSTSTSSSLPTSSSTGSSGPSTTRPPTSTTTPPTNPATSVTVASGGPPPETIAPTPPVDPVVPVAP